MTIVTRMLTACTGICNCDLLKSNHEYSVKLSVLIFQKLSDNGYAKFFFPDITGRDRVVLV